MKTASYNTEPHPNDILGQKLALVSRNEMPHGLETAIMEKVETEAARMKRFATWIRCMAIAAGGILGIVTAYAAIRITDTDLHSILADTISLFAAPASGIAAHGSTFIPLFSAAAAFLFFYLLLDTLFKRRDETGAPR